MARFRREHRRAYWSEHPILRNCDRPAAGHFEAGDVGADRFREDLDRTDGVRDQGEVLARALSRMATGTPPAPRHPWTSSNEGVPGQWQARWRLQRTWTQAIGLVAGGVFAWVTLSRGTRTDDALCKGIRKADAGRALEEALTRLADFYAIGDVTPPPDRA